MARYAHIENNEITGVYDFLPENWRNISNFKALESETDYINSLGWRKIEKNAPEYDPNTQYIGNPKYTLVDDKVVEDIEIFDIQVHIPTPEYVPPPTIDNNSLHIMAMRSLREQRDQLLKETDFTQLVDVAKLNGVDVTTAYETYRQQLRDLPGQYENDDTFLDVSTVVFPTVVLPTTEQTPPTDSGV